jgi:hypothetical protein
MAEGSHPENGQAAPMAFLFIAGECDSAEEWVEEYQLGGERMDALLVIDVQNGIVRAGNFSDELQKMEKSFEILKTGEGR